MYFLHPSKNLQYEFTSYVPRVLVMLLTDYSTTLRGRCHWVQNTMINPFPNHTKDRFQRLESHALSYKSTNTHLPGIRNLFFVWLGNGLDYSPMNAMMTQNMTKTMIKYKNLLFFPKISGTLKQTAGGFMQCRARLIPQVWRRNESESMTTNSRNVPQRWMRGTMTNSLNVAQEWKHMYDDEFPPSVVQGWKPRHGDKLPKCSTEMKMGDDDELPKCSLVRTTTPSQNMAFLTLLPRDKPIAFALLGSEEVIVLKMMPLSEGKS